MLSAAILSSKCKIFRIEFITASLLFSFCGTVVKSQVLPVGIFEPIEDLVRRRQLMGLDSSSVSYMIRPITAEWMKGSSKRISIMPLVMQNQYNTHHPYGMNDGAMVPAKGYQVMISGGVVGKIGPLRVQLRPELVYAENKAFKELFQEDNGTTFSDAFARRVFNFSDLPDRFGEEPYTKMSWGQSSISLTFQPISVGLSNENLWWGPGTRSSLLMSNNAPGFKHLTINTSRPVNVYVGTIEAQVVAGRLESSGIEHPEDPRYLKKRDDWRYFSGIVMTYQPKWLPGLHLGFDRTFIMYHSDVKSFGEYFPLFSSVAKKSFYNPDNTENTEDQTNRDQYISFFARWVMPASRAELYFQFGRNDHSWDLRDAFVEPEHSSAYVAGFRKLVPLKAQDEFLQLGFEISRLAGAATGKFRAQPSWYAHHQVRHGYTNEGQVLGAGIGPGGNLWTLDLSWVKGLKKIGLQVEDLKQNDDIFNHDLPENIGRWSDLGFSAKFDYDFHNFIVNSQLSFIKSSNHHYIIGNSLDNLSARLGIVYFFK